MASRRMIDYHPIMLFGVCTSLENSAAVKAAGWDFVEERADSFLAGLTPDSQWKLRRGELPVLAAYVLVPAAVKITGPEASKQKQRDYMSVVIDRAAKAGIKTLVFGSAGARNVPDGWNHDQARQQIVDFLKMCTPLLKEKNITIAIEHLGKAESNIITSVSEALMYVREIDHPNIRLLVDTHHFWSNDEPLDSLAPAAEYCVHVHVSDKNPRTAPGETGKSDYRPIFAPLKSRGYNGRISVEAKWADFSDSASRVLEFIKQQWKEA